MPKILPYAALTAAIALAGPALAQTPAPAAAAPSAAPPASTAPAAPGVPSSTAPAVAPGVTPGAIPGSTTSATAPTTVNPSPTAPAATARTGASVDTAATSTNLMSGMSVKDNTGALIGEVKSIKGGIATIAMGSDTFTVDTNKLGVTGGAATINATQAELKQMLPKKK